MLALLLFYQRAGPGDAAGAAEEYKRGTAPMGRLVSAEEPWASAMAGARILRSEKRPA
jgi:hypothetical protein